MKKFVVIILMGLAVVNCVGCNAFTEKSETTVNECESSISPEEVRENQVIIDTINEKRKQVFIDDEYSKELEYNSSVNKY